MAFLLDVNVLIALLDPAHVHHDDAHEWFAGGGHAQWVTCPITENAVLRILGHASYPNSPGPPAAVAPILARFCALPSHNFWPDDLSALASDHLDPQRLLTSGQVTDSYLLAMACAHGETLATFDRRLVAEAVPEGKRHLCVL